MKTWHMLWRLFLSSPGLYFLSILLQIPRRLIFLVPALIVSQLFDGLGASKPLPANFWYLIALFVGVGLARVVLLVVSTYTELFSQYNTTALLRKNVLTHILRQPGANALPASPGDMINRLQEDTRSIAFALTMFIFTFGVGSEMLLALAIMAHIDLLITLIAVLPLLIGGIIVNIAGRRIQYYRSLNRQATGKVNAYLGEAFGAVQAIQVATAEIPVIEELTRLNARRRRAALRESLFNEVLLSFFNAGATNIASALVVLLAGQALQARSFTVGDFLLFTTYLTSLSGFIGLVSNEIMRYKQITVASERLLPLLFGAPARELVQTGSHYQHGALPEISASEESASACLETLEVRNLTYRYPGSGRGIEAVHLHLRRGQLVVITGRV
ncbi:MAG TPA: ABC transporter ATP-binding protein, partial [Ktedonobacteraceae bacterium]|nr:ABC transporter ATP-binding protein [Ktedonobacteraceae bacterium]